MALYDEPFHSTPPRMPGQARVPFTVTGASTLSRVVTGVENSTSCVSRLRTRSMPSLPAVAINGTVLPPIVASYKGPAWVTSQSCVSCGTNCRYQATFPVCASSATMLLV